MTEHRQLENELEKLDYPVALIHQGFFLYANQPFLSLIGYSSAKELEAVSLLDLTTSIDKDALKKHLKSAQHSTKENEKHPSIDITLLRKGLAKHKCCLKSHSIEYKGEDAILCYFPPSDFTANKNEDHPFSTRRVADRKTRWDLYLSFGLISLLLFGPLLLLDNLRVNNVPRVYLPETAPAVIADDKARQVFPKDEGMLFLFEGVAPFSDGFLKALDSLTNALNEHPEIEKTYSITTQDHIEGAEGDFIIEPLINVEEIQKLSEDERKHRVLSDRFAKKTLVPITGDGVAIIVIPVALNDSFARISLQSDIYKLVETQGLSRHLSAEAGQVTTDVEQAKEFFAQMAVFVPFTAFLGILMIWIHFHRVMALFVSTIIIAAVAGSTIALYVITDIPFNLISSILPTMIMALTIAALVHLFNALQYAAARGQKGPDRVKMALNKIRNPALYNALTSAAGFASLGLSDIPPIKFLGFFAAIGVVLIYFVVYHLVPHFFKYYDRAPWPVKSGRRNALDTVVKGMFQTSVRHPIATLTTIALLLAAGSSYLSNIKVETNLLEFFSKTHKTRVATEHIEEKLAGTGSLDIIFTTEEEEGLANSNKLFLIKELQNWLEQQPEIDHSRSFADFIEEMNWGFHSEQPDYRSIPHDTELIKQYLFVYDGEDIYDFVDESYQTARISVNINVHGATDTNLLIERISSQLKQNATSDLNWEIAGFSRMFAEQVDLLISGQVKSIAGALLIIFALMMIQWRSLKDSLICMLPNFSPILLIFILMGIFNIWLDVATAMIASVAVGIAIDDTIHVYHGFIHRVKNGVNPVVAISRTFRHAGRAVVTTTSILCVQFLVLVFSDFTPLKHFGLLTSVGLLAALIFDLLFLPAVMILAYSPKKHLRAINSKNTHSHPTGT